MKYSSLLSTAMLAFLCGTASAGTPGYTLSGSVSNAKDGKAIQGANVKLLIKDKATTTDADGKFTIHEDEIPDTEGIAATRKTGYFSMTNGVLNFSGNNTIQVKVYDLVGNLLMNKAFQGSGSIDLAAAIGTQGNYLARIKSGSAQEVVRFSVNSNSAGAISTGTRNILKKDGDVISVQNDTLLVTADGYDTLKIALWNIDTTLTIKLYATSTEETYAFGYALKNEPRPSKGCGVDSKLKSVGQNSNAKKYNMTSAGLNREFWITLPKNYDKTKPYKILFAMHCMGSNAEDFTNHYPDQDHPSPYYGQQNLDKNNEFIFVAPRGDTDYMPWRTGDNKDHIFFGELLTLLEENYCIDTSRVFMTGFSFGAMVTNSMAQDFQDRIRAVAVYATADYNIYLPTNKGKPIAWMAVHGKKDGTCDYNRAKNSALKRILKNNGKADADGNFSDASAETPKEVGGSGHLCYDFTTVDERFPVKFCSWNGQHQWTAFDNGNWQNTWVPEEVHKFFDQF